ncbi:lysophospholipid acyltransferase family protein [Candidatus Vondammii sp. HM_W22]|uniref:lysophospholipid acyltransferase family protein n=1 Tax=Candidatus Vondammii sp. HM_W22 TaxID=2687299 RepID=UPI001F132F57|nr:lysophospholipid acyltransferase family protein [Candidatus Vondammii sp. HM_W22]
MTLPLSIRRRAVLFIVALFSRFPLRVSQSIGVALGWLVYLLPNREKRTAETNIATCLPELTRPEQSVLLRQTLIENAKTLLEMPAVWLGDPSIWIARVVPGKAEDICREILAQGRGLIAIGTHQGNWEVGIHYLSSLSKVTALYRPPRAAELDGLIKAGRTSSGVNMLSATPKGVKGLYTAIKNGEMAALLADQQPKAAGRQGSVFAPFLGRPALTMVLACRLAKRTGAPVLFMFAERLPGAKGYQMHWFKGPDEIYDANLVVAATAMNRGLESCIRYRPSQYLWSYRRFTQQRESLRAPDTD